MASVLETRPDTSSRIARLRALMKERSWDAVVLRRIADIQWLCGLIGVFDDEIAHTAFISEKGLWLHTDSRYYNALVAGMGEDSGWVIDKESVAHPAWVASLVKAEGITRLAVEDSLELSFFDALCEGCPATVDMPRMSGEIIDLRMVKDDTEIALMRRAQQLTDDAFEHICTFIRPGVSEKEILLELQNYMLASGADGNSFSPIIASGPNGANPHARPSQRKVEEGDFVVLDYGASYRDYRSDMTRTVCVGTPSKEQRRVYDVVRATHEACAEAIHAGVIGSDIHKLSVQLIADAGYKEFYGHGLGHGVGLEIHERPNFSPTYDKTIPDHAVVTVEPGIYLPGRFGVRLEDYGLVTNEGFEPFTASTHELVCIPC